MHTAEQRRGANMKLRSCPTVTDDASIRAIDHRLSFFISSRLHVFCSRPHLIVLTEEPRGALRCKEIRVLGPYLSALHRLYIKAS